MRKPFKRIVIGLASIIGAMTLYILIQVATGNFHEAIPGELYRSGQPNAKDIHAYTKRYGIKSIINLRGTSENAPWYIEETTASRDAGVAHYDFRMSANHELSEENALALIAMMREAPKPLLIHCRSGADRTGLAAAIYFAAVANRGEWAAEEQMWMHYGHLPFYLNATFAMNRTFERLEPLFGFHDS